MRPRPARPSLRQGRCDFATSRRLGEPSLTLCGEGCRSDSLTRRGHRSVREFNPRLEVPLLDPELRSDLGIIAANLLDEPLGVLASDEGVACGPRPLTGDSGRRRVGTSRTKREGICRDVHGSRLRQHP